MDMRDTCEEKQTEIKKAIKKGLSKKQKELMILAMEFGYASAFCSRTCDMREMWFAGGDYINDYEQLRKELCSYSKAKGKRMVNDDSILGS